MAGATRGPCPPRRRAIAASEAASRWGRRPEETQAEATSFARRCPACTSSSRRLCLSRYRRRFLPSPSVRHVALRRMPSSTSLVAAVGGRRAGDPFPFPFPCLVLGLGLCSSLSPFLPSPPSPRGLDDLASRHSRSGCGSNRRVQQIQMESGHVGCSLPPPCLLHLVVSLPPSTLASSLALLSSLVLPSSLALALPSPPSSSLPLPFPSLAPFLL